jgi:hypothetical protein
MNVKGRAYITQEDNDKYFEQSLPTDTWGFCMITRLIRDVEPDKEFGGFTGILKSKGRSIPVSSSDYDGDHNYYWEID